MTVGQSDVRCCGDILRIRTRKHKNTCACIVGMEETFKLSVNLSESKIVDIFQPLHEVYHVYLSICFQLSAIELFRWAAMLNGLVFHARILPRSASNVPWISGRYLVYWSISLQNTVKLSRFNNAAFCSNSTSLLLNKFSEALGVVTTRTTNNGKNNGFHNH